MNFFKSIKNGLLSKKEESQDTERDYPIFDNAEDKWVEYFYPSTYNEKTDQGVFRNFYGIKDSLKLRNAEKFIVSQKLSSAFDVKGDFDLNHLKEIHKTIFGDLYSWAGEPREIHMANKNGEDRFISPVNFEKESLAIFNGIKQNPVLNNEVEVTKNEFADHLAEAYLSINRLHYFREGNGRAQGVFIDQLAQKNGYQLNLTETINNKSLKKEFYSYFNDESKDKIKDGIKSFFSEKLQPLSTEKKIDLKALSKTNNAEMKKEVKQQFQQVLSKVQKNMKNEKLNAVKRENKNKQSH